MNRTVHGRQPDLVKQQQRPAYLSDSFTASLTLYYPPVPSSRPFTTIPDLTTPSHRPRHTSAAWKSAHEPLLGLPLPASWEAPEHSSPLV